VERSVVTSDGVLAALAALGHPAVIHQAVTDRELPLLLGALLAVVETEVMHQAVSADRQPRVVDGAIAQTSADEDPTHLALLAALRLERTAIELGRILGGTEPPGREVVALAVQAARAASIATTAHLSATHASGYHRSDQSLHAHLLALETGVTNVVEGYNAVVDRFREGA
jgi:hypothetical protein